MTKKQRLLVRDLQTREIVHEVDVTGNSERAVERVMMGMLRNMSERYFIDDSEAGGEEPKETKR